MHRRARHLNAKAAGAGLVLDARRISGLNDGDAVSTWNDVSGNGRDASNTLTARPLYKTFIKGGQPVVRFDGSNDTLIFTPELLFNQTAHSICVYKRTESGARMVPLGGLLASCACPVYEYSDNRLYVQGNNRYTSVASIGVAWRISTASALAGPEFMLRINGGAVTLGTLISYATTGMTAIGRADSGYSVGDIALVSFFNSDLGDSLKRRLEHSAAFSFKIQCS